MTSWPDPQSFVSHSRAKRIRQNIDMEREATELLCGPEPLTTRDRAAVEAFRQECERRSRPVPPRPPAAGPPCGICGAEPARRHLNAHLCAQCAPVVATPDPNLTADAFRARRELHLRALRSRTS